MPDPSSPLRSASLTSRRTSPIPWLLWLLPWVIWLSGLLILGIPHLGADAEATLGWRLALPADAAARLAFLVSVTLQAILGPVLIASGLLGVRMSRVEPEPMDPAGTPELGAAYRVNRKVRAWAIYCGSVTMVTFMTLMNLATGDHSLTLFFAISGCVIGLLGATVGVYFAVRHRRIDRQYQELLRARAD